MAHVAIMVSDIEKSLDFYRHRLGFDVVSPEEHIDGAVAEMVDMPRGAHVGLPVAAVGRHRRL